MFQARDVREKCWWNLGGWGNHSHAIEGAGVECEHVPGRIETGRWYDIRIELSRSHIKCFLDGKLIHDVVRTPLPSLYACAGLKNPGGDIIVKVVNVLDRPQEATIALSGGGAPAATGQAIVLASASGDDENSFDAPRKVATREEKLAGAAGKFSYTFPANSVTVLRVPRK